MKKLLIKSFFISFMVSGMFMAPIKSDAKSPPIGLVGCVLPEFNIHGQAICPVGMIINAIGSCCVAMQNAPTGGICTPCSSCTGKGAGACHLICKDSCNAPH